MFDIDVFSHSIDEVINTGESEPNFGGVIDTFEPNTPLSVAEISSGWKLEDTENANSVYTRRGIHKFETYMKENYKLFHKPSKNLNIKYNTSTKELAVKHKGKWKFLTQESDKSKFYAPSQYPITLQRLLGVSELQQPSAKQTQSLKETQERMPVLSEMLRLKTFCRLQIPCTLRLERCSSLWKLKRMVYLCASLKLSTTECSNCEVLLLMLRQSSSR